MQKWEKDGRGMPRFRCKTCGVSRIRKRSDLSQKYKQQLFEKWLLGKDSLKEIAQQYTTTRQSLHTWFKPFWQLEPQPKHIDFRGSVLIIDGKYAEKNAAVLIATTRKSVISWQFTQRENNTSWSTFLGSLKQIPFAVCCDGQRGMLKAIKQRYPGIVVQRCQFHVMKYCLSKLTKNPESRAAVELSVLVLQIARIKTRHQLKYWFSDYRNWFQNHTYFLKEKTCQLQNLTPTGRPKWHYTHGRLHAAHSHLKNAIPNLFHYLKYPQIPNTTNFVEGAINAPMQEKLRFHRGLKLDKRRILIAHFLASKQS